VRVRITDLDGKLPNLALMRLSHYHKNQDDEVVFERNPVRSLFEPEDYDIVYGSSIFTKSEAEQNTLKGYFDDAIVGGTGTDSLITVESIIGDYAEHDYTLYPEFKWSIGFTQRGCRFNCPFCLVPSREGRPSSAASIHDIWQTNREKKILLLDNDFFGNPDWEARAKEIVEGNFEVSLNQGINARVITDEQTHWLFKIKCRDGHFKTPRVYTAWDRPKDEKLFFEGCHRIIRAGVRPKDIMVYMLVGFIDGETFDEILYRFEKIKETGMLPFPMVYENRQDLKKFQRWVVRRYHEIVSWEEFKKGYHKNEVQQEDGRLF